MTTWTNDTIWWHVYPLGFTGAPIRPSSDQERETLPRLRHIEGALDHLIELGCNGLALGPIFTSASHGYDTLDFYEIDSRLGTMEDFDSLIAACKQRGIRVMLDGVFNHVGASGELTKYTLEDSVFEGHGGLLTLDHSREEVATLVRDVMKFWLAKGIDAWRLDAAYAVPPTFWDRVIPAVKDSFPEAWFVGEVIHGDYVEFAKHMDSVTQYELWKAIWSGLKDGNFFELDWCLKRNNELLDSFVPYTFIGNHDVTRIESQTGRAKAALALTILMTVPGIPAIYYGDELGFAGFKEDRQGGDDAVRPMFPADPDTGNPVYELHQRLIAFRRRHPELTTGRVEICNLENLHCTYRCEGVEVELLLEGAPRAFIRSPKEPEIKVQLPELFDA